MDFRLFFYFHFSRRKRIHRFSNHTFYSSIYADIHRYDHRRGFPRRLTTQPIKLIKYHNIIYSCGESHNTRRPTRQRRYHILYLVSYDEHLIT